MKVLRWDLKCPQSGRCGFQQGESVLEGGYEAERREQHQKTTGLTGCSVLVEGVRKVFGGEWVKELYGELEEFWM